MSESQGRIYKDRLDSEADEYAALHSLFNKLITTEETKYKHYETYREKWDQIGRAEEDPDLKTAFTLYSEVLARTQNSHAQIVQHLKQKLQEPLRQVPLKIKSQRQALNTHSKLEREGLKRTATLKRAQDQGDEAAIRRAATQVTEFERERVAEAANIQRNMQQFEQDHVNDMKNIMLHLINAEMYYHSSALQALSDFISKAAHIN